MKEIKTEWESIIGLEVHVQLATKSKLFSGASTKFGAAPNSQACNIDLGMPGVLPVLNEEVLKMAIRFGLAINAKINSPTTFARKNYFYPDLPKGYQISQLDNPVVENGSLDIHIEGKETKTIGITRAHLEEDAGKSLHEDFEGMSGIDLNRAGTPLLEIVSEPDLRSSSEAVSYLKSIHSIIKYLEISDGNMSEGSMRCDANVSIRKKGETKFGTRTETKNVNSFRFVEKAIDFEINRQIELVSSGQKIIQETRLYDSQSNTTRSMRSKEFANDYRYFPEPDLLPVLLDKRFINDLKLTLPELPQEKQVRLIKEYGLNEYDSGILSSDKDLANYFEEVTSTTNLPKKSANWVIGEIAAFLNKENLHILDSKIDAKSLGKLILRIEDKTISGKIAKEVFEEMWLSSRDADDIINSKDLQQVTDQKEIEKFIITALKDNPKQVEQYKSGKDRLLSFFVGQVMKASKGKANPQQVNQLIEKKLKE